MISTDITNKTIKSAIDALQKGDKITWLALFTDSAEMTDDGNPVNFKRFSDNAIGRERFTSIDKIENDGKDIYGNFHSDQWGDFKVFFKFQLDAEDKIFRLDIGQA